MLCSRCKKRMAVVFITRLEGEKSINDGLCLQCAKELNIKPVTDMIQKMGIDEDQMDLLNNEMQNFVEGMENGDVESMMPLFSDTDDPEHEGQENEGQNEENFQPGGTASFPFLQNVFGSQESNTKNGKKERNDGENAKKKKRKNLESFCINLNDKARSGNLDRIVGREREISRIIQILCRRTKNNPCLIGEPGVGKTAIAEGLALQIVDKKVPAKLLDKEIHLLDLAALVAGTQFRGQFESRIKGLIDEVVKDGNVILFIDEVHNLVGVGDSEGSMNAANILKPSLSRGIIQVIGATTFEEYRKYIEKDAALERRFQSVKVEEPSISDTIAMLNETKEYYEKFHNVKISTPMVSQIVNLSERYINDRFLPDKAIDLLDESAACCALRSNVISEVESLRRSLLEATRKREQLELKAEEDSAVHQEKYFAQIAELKAEECRLEGSIAEKMPAFSEVQVTLDDVANVIELWTGIPSSQIKERELSRLSKLGEKLKVKIIGQDEAINALTNAVRRSRVRISAGRRPASFIFVGPTGVGKTELVKVLAEELFDTPETLIRLDMSEFMEKFSVSRIIGAPPGYVGYDEAGQLTEKVRRKPYSVILLDEIEKAHPDVMNILLQILDDGRITDAHGRTVSFENTVIVMTSNAGSNLKDSAVGFNRSADMIAKEKAMKSLSEFLRPEFLSRVDEIIVFRHLEEADYKKICVLMLDEFKASMQEHGVRFIYDDALLVYLVEKAKTGKNGARELRHTIRREVEDKLAQIMVEEGENLSDSIYFSVYGGKVAVIKK